MASSPTSNRRGSRSASRCIPSRPPRLRRLLLRRPLPRRLLPRPNLLGGALSFRLLVTDLDGTLVGGGGALNPRDLAAIAELRRRGVVVSIATGRMYSGTRDVARRIGVTGPVACIDGSHIVDAATDADLACHVIDGASLVGLGAILRDAGAATVVFSDNVIFYDDASEPHLPFLSVWSDRTERVPNVLAEPRWAAGAGAAALVAVAHGTPLARARARIAAELGDSVQAILFIIDRAGTAGMVIRASGVTKGTALEWLARHHGVEPQEVVAVGDWLNDIPMFHAAGRSYCMAQSPPEVVAAASMRLDADGWSGGGIAEAAERAGML